MSAKIGEGRFTLTDEDGDRLVVRPPGEPPHDIFRLKMKAATGCDVRVFATADEMRALRDYLNDAPCPLRECDAMRTSEMQRLYGVTYRDTDGRARHVRIWADCEAEAIQHAARQVVGFERLERAFLVKNDPYEVPALPVKGEGR